MSPGCLEEAKQITLWITLESHWLPGGASGKESACQWRRHKRLRFDPWVGKSPWRRAWQPILYSCLENPMDRGAWRATVHRVAKSQTRLKWLSRHTSDNLKGSAVVGRGREIQEGYVFMLMYGRNQHDIVKQLSSNYKLNKQILKERKKGQNIFIYLLSTRQAPAH